jgi:ribosomal protein S16
MGFENMVIQNSWDPKNGEYIDQLNNYHKHGMAYPWVADGENGLQIWTTTANILSKQSLTANKRWSASFRVGQVP